MRQKSSYRSDSQIVQLDMSIGKYPLYIYVAFFTATESQWPRRLQSFQWGSLPTMTPGEPQLLKSNEFLFPQIPQNLKLLDKIPANIELIASLEGVQNQVSFFLSRSHRKVPCGMLIALSLSIS